MELQTKPEDMNKKSHSTKMVLDHMRAKNHQYLLEIEKLEKKIEEDSEEMSYQTSLDPETLRTFTGSYTSY